MGVVKREGKWTLEKQEDGVYLIKNRKQVQAKIITDDYVPSGMMDERSGIMPVYEVTNFKAAKHQFKEYVKDQESSGIW